jgi:hypothetical protein
MRQGSYLTYTSDGLSGGDDLDQIENPATYEFPPGKVTLGCATPPGMDERGTVEFEVIDPDGYWRTETLADFGCSGIAGLTDWVPMSGEGASAELAAEGLLDDFAETLDRDRSDYTAESAPTGYSGAATQTWIGFRLGVPDFSIEVTQTGDTYTAIPDVSCD